LTAIVSEENLRDLLGFIIDDPGDVQITVGAASANAGAAGSGATTSSEASGEGFGFFDDSPGAPEAASGAAEAVPEAFGFFGDSPGAPQAVSGVPAAVPEAYGFFGDSPGAPQTASGVPQAAEAYGFFADSPGNPSASASAQGGSVSAQASGSVAAQASGSLTSLKPVAANAPGAEAVAAGAVAAKPAGAKAPAAKGAGANKDADSTIRVSLAKIDHLINLVGEMVIGQARLERVSSDLDPAAFHDLHATVTQMQHNMRDLQQGVMSIRMLPLRFVFERFPRMVRELATKLNKVVKLQTSGDETVLDKVLIEQLADPLTHLIRNSLDHGIESPERRVAAGKSPEGTISLRAWHQGGEVMVELSDDGGGLNKERILAKAAESGLPCSPDMPLRDVWQLIFAPGFSTAETVTDVSGRGVGMDVVSKNITHIGGRVDIESEAGYGTKVTIRLPLTLAILDGLSVVVGGEIYMIPLTNIIESLQPLPGAIRTVAGGGRIIHVRDEYFPIVTLSDVMPPRVAPATRADETGAILVLLEAGNGRVALLVDDLEGQHQVVIKSLETNFRHVPGISGATVMGNGRVALIIDVASFVRHAGARAAA
jgi:two-component system chemotaxis sensor kinase CheA